MRIKTEIVNDQKKPWLSTNLVTKTFASVYISLLQSVTIYTESFFLNCRLVFVASCKLSSEVKRRVIFLIENWSTD